MASGALVLGLAACSSSTSPTNVSLSGTVRDYFTNTVLASAISLDGLSTLNAMSSSTGVYQFPALPVNSSMLAVTSLANYRATRNPAVHLGTSAVAADLFAVSNADATRQFTGLSLAATAGTAVVFANLVTSVGVAREGIPLADITLVNSLNAPVGAGPYFFGAGGDVVSNGTLAASTAFSGRARVGFLNVPPGTLTLKVNVTTPAVATLTVQVVASANGVTLVER